MVSYPADQMQAVAQTSRTQLGAGLGGAVLAALWGAWSGASGLIAALNIAYREEEARTFFRRSRDALVVALATGVFMVLAFALLTLFPLVLERVPLDPAARRLPPLPAGPHWLCCALRPLECSTALLPAGGRPSGAGSAPARPLGRPCGSSPQLGSRSTSHTFPLTRP
ncbi:YihY/virulence factor BrkB family protein [Microvirga aerilata]|uniref:YihY/virulence factor BrkB family protein n=1 Tax=Microvirga aerilata TaxID=670292 RepID=A0A936Z9V2_9HYPH|nr:YihY/virulence factor BrkB family protein [Microvirga aerilata]